MVSEEVELILKSHQLILRDRRWEHSDNYEKSKVIDEQITDLLNPKQETTLQDLTKDILGDK